MPFDVSPTVTVLTTVQSASNTTIPSSTQIIDDSGYIYTLAGGQIYRGGIVDAGVSNVALLLWFNLLLYRQDNSSSWFQLITSAWPVGPSGWSSIAGDPRP